MTIFKPGGSPRFRHQIEGLRKIIECKGSAALLFDPGTGKTAVAIDFMCLLALKDPNKTTRILVTAPNSVLDTWLLQAEIWMSPQVRWHAEIVQGSREQRYRTLSTRGSSLASSRWQGVGKHGAVRRSANIQDTSLPLVIMLIMNYETFGVGSDKAAAALKAVREFNPALVIADEMHKLKGRGSLQSRMMGRIARIVPRRLGLTGTVMPKGAEDVFGQWRFIDHTAFGQPSAKIDAPREPARWIDFERRFLNVGQFRQPIGYKNLHQLRAIMEKRALVVKKDDVLDLPSVTHVPLPFKLSPTEWRAYTEVANFYATNLGEGVTVEAVNSLSKHMKLRQIAAGLAGTGEGESTWIGDSKVRAVSELVNETLASEQRVVVFTYFKAEAARLSEMLNISGTTVFTIGADTPQEKRLAYRQQFGNRNDKRRIVLIAQVATISMGVNELVTASHAVFSTLTLQRADFIQARDRLHRTGQTKPVTFWYPLAEDTLDPLILQSHEQGTNLEASILKHIQELRMRQLAPIGELTQIP